MKYKETNFDLNITEKADKFLEDITYFIFLPNGTKLI